MIRTFWLKCLGCVALLAASNFAAHAAEAATVVALGAGNTYGKGVRARSAANDIELF